MITLAELDSIARARLADAYALLQAGRYDGAVYVCGYALETMLKVRMCRTLNWTTFPATRAEFEGLTSLRTHNLDVLLRLSGVESEIKSRFATEWHAAAIWEPELRYRSIGTATEASARLMIQSVQSLVDAL